LLTRNQVCEIVIPDRSHHGDDENKKPNPTMSTSPLNQLQEAGLTHNFRLNQIVRGKNTGVFVILDFKTIANIPMAILKAVNPDNLSETAPGQIALDFMSIKPYSAA
jgi:hypothetical protein